MITSPLRLTSAPRATFPQQLRLSRVSPPTACRKFGLVAVCFLINAFAIVRLSLCLLYRPQQVGGHQKAVKTGRLAVVVPAHGGDLSRALASLSHWPSKCLDITLRHVELVLYYAGDSGEPGWNDDYLIPWLEQTGGKCFARTSVIFGNLTDEENVYPKGASVQFYKLFLDERLKAQLKRFQAIAIIEWDVRVTHDRSFEKLYHAAFDAVEPFWVKGSTLAGTNFHETAAITDHWHVLGHINGNAIYNNSDPAFVEFVNFTLSRWEYSYSYDVALWATVADFPYSWPLWQRFANKFVTTNLIANVGFLEVDEKTAGHAVEKGTMFIHGSVNGGGGTQYAAGPSTSAAGNRPQYLTPAKEGQNSLTDMAESSTGALSRLDTTECRAECGKTMSGGGGDGNVILSTVCDHNWCSSTEPGSDRQFGRHACGAGDEERYGGHCRLCYVDSAQALRVERRLRSQAARLGRDVDQHVIMCDTLRPPQSDNCSLKCAIKLDTICDHRCGSGHFHDYNCNWRDHGENCRFCFDDIDAAIVADEAAKRKGGRVIMCNTHEPPVKRAQADVDALKQDRMKAEAVEGKGASSGSAVEDTAVPVIPSMLPYTKDLVRGELCAFTTGYFAFLRETQASVESVRHFMPGMRVRVAVDPVYFSVFNRTIGGHQSVEIVNATTAGGHASLLADVLCGEGTKLILYLRPGEVISRTFTRKDTHGTRGDLLVPFTETQRLDEFHLRRTQATTAVLGFSAPSFSYGTDLVLPAWGNRELRHHLTTGASTMSRPLEQLTEEEEQQLAISRVLDIENAHVPELLAALAYSQNSPGIWFLNPQQWVTHHMFKDASVWDIPLVKPRFGCSTNLQLALVGYDVAHELNRLVNSGGGNSRSMCEPGFFHLDASTLLAKPSIEFGAPACDNRPMPDVKHMRVSVIYDVATAAGIRGEASMLNATLPTVMKNFPDALEAVVVVADEAAKKIFQQIVDGYQESAPFDLKVVIASGWRWSGVRRGSSSPKASERRDYAAELRYPLLWADTYCSGQFVMHLNADSVLLENVSYDHIFHFRKPVIPFTRFTDTDISHQQQHPGDACWRFVASEALALPADEQVVHDFAGFDSHVYPMELYPALRAHLRATEERKGILSEVMLIGECNGEAGGRKERFDMRRRFQREMQYNLMATFLWYRMHHSIHWRAIDPLDLTADEWLTEPDKYRAYRCNLGLELGLPKEYFAAATADTFRKQVLELGSVGACEELGASVNTKGS